MKFLVIFVLGFALTRAYHLEELDKTNFGKSLLDTVNIQLNSGQSVDDLMSVLDQMRDTMNAQKEEQEHEHQEFQQDCAKDIEFYQQEIAQATVLIVDSQRAVDQANEELKIIQSMLDEVFQKLKVYQSALQKLNDLRGEEAKAFKQSMEEHDITTTAIQESKRYFVQIRGEMSFLQNKKTLLAQISSHFSNAKQLVKNKKYGALFHIMGQMTSKTTFDNAEIVAKILELCDRVLENVNESRMDEQQAENEKIRLYEEKKKILDENIFNTQTKINTLDNQKIAVLQHLAIVTQVLEDNTKRRDENTELMNSRLAECNNEVADYQTMREKRQGFFSLYQRLSLDQISVVEKIVTVTETGLATMKQYMKERRDESGVKVNMKI